MLERELSIVEPSAGRSTAPPIDDAELAARMAAFAPFEPRPEIAVAVSGGPDSLALTLLLSRWVDAHGGTLRAVTLDHGIRTESADEAAWVADQLARHGIAHTTLTWRPAVPDRVTHADAREIRYERLSSWCAARGILHLTLAHHRDDQAETLLARVRTGSGPDGLAGMPAVRYGADLRLLRPLRDIPKARLEATLAAIGQPWIADPSNADTRYGRPHLRRLMPALAEYGMTAGNLAAYADAMGRTRARLDAARAELVGAAVAVFPEGYAAIDRGPVLDAHATVANAVMGRVLRCIGGRDHVPRGRRLDRLMAGLRAEPGRARTLGGCRIVPWRGQWLVVREPGRAPRTPVPSAGALLYDGRFRITVAGTAGAEPTIACLSETGWAALCAHDPSLKSSRLPAVVRPALPALHDANGPFAVPHLGWRRAPKGPLIADCTFVPRRSVGESAFTVAPAPRHII